MMWRAAVGLVLAATLQAAPPPKRPPAMDRWQKMSPADRQRALRRLPAERRDNLEKRLQRYEELNARERESLERRYEWFQHLPPERQELARNLFRRLQDLRPARQQAVRDEFQRLRGLSADERRQTLQGAEYRQRFKANERDLLGGFVRLLEPGER
jgi:hypothetical protein